MSKREIKAGATSQTVDVFIQDSSVSTGAGLTGLVYNTSNLTAYYRKGATGTPTAITLATQTVGGAYSSGGFVAVDGTNCPGQYRLDIPNAALDTAGMVTIYLKGATNMAPCVMELEIVAVDKFDAVRGGMTALPNANAEAAGGLYTRGTGAGQINQANNGQIDVNAARTGGTTNTGRDIGASVLISSGTGTGQLSVTSGVIESIVAAIQTTPLDAIIDGVLDEHLSTHVVSGSLGQTQQDIFTFAGAAGGTTLPAIKAQTDKIPASPASTTNITAGTITTVTNLTNAPTNGDLTATMKASVTAAVPTAAAITTAVWAAGSRSLTTFGTLAADTAAAVWAITTASLTTAGTIGKLIVDNLNATVSSVFSRLGAPAGASVSADIAAIKAETSLIVADTGSDGVALSTDALSALADAVTDEPLSGHTTTGTVGASLANVYAAQIDYVDDDGNEVDEFTVQWFRNGAPVTSGITSPTIQVIKRADGTDLVAATSMTQIGTTGAYKYDESTAANRISAGEAVLVQVQATIDGAARTWRKVVGRDDIA